MPEHSAINPNSLVCQSLNQISCNIDGETVTMSTDKGIYYRIDEIGSRTWTLINKPITVVEICSQLESEFDVDHDECARDVIDFLTDLHTYDLVTITPDEKTG